MRHPALILRAELAGTVNAAHAQNGRRNGKGFGIIQHILIGHALGAAIGRAEIQRTLLRNPVGADAGLGGTIAILRLDHGKIGQGTIDLVVLEKITALFVPPCAPLPAG